MANSPPFEDTGTAAFSQSKSALAFPDQIHQWTGDHY
jgi:hypothetical protein